MNDQVKFKVNAHVDAKVKFQAKVLTMVMLKPKIRPNLRSRIGLQFKSQLQANMVKLQCKVRLSFIAMLWLRLSLLFRVTSSFR